MNILKERYNEAVNNKKNDIKSFVWKGRKVKVGDSFVQEEIKLVDASDTQLMDFYNYCNTMLYNTSKDNLGRVHVLSVIHDQYMRCNAELCLRDLESNEDGPKIPRYKLNMEIQTFLSKNPELNLKDLTFGDAANVAMEHADIPLSLIVEGCIDKLGAFDRRHLKLSFITKQGLWLTQAEIKDLIEKEGDLKAQGKTIDEIVKERFNINANIKLKLIDTGLTYAQLRAMLQLKNKKYNDLTTEQLKTLRNRILFNLSNEVKLHIKQWQDRMEQIKMVAKTRGINLL